jgi:hypothetical protein
MSNARKYEKQPREENSITKTGNLQKRNAGISTKRERERGENLPRTRRACGVQGAR